LAKLTNKPAKPLSSFNLERR